MDKRQALIFSFGILVILAWVSACSPLNTPKSFPSQTPIKSPTPTLSTPILTEPSPTPSICVEQRGHVEEVAFDSVTLPEFYIYLPACYSADVEKHYPVLYLLHGAGFEADQWIRLGAAEKADSLIAADQTLAYLIVMPYEKYSMRIVGDDDFGEVLVDELIPYVDEHFRTLEVRENRAIGGLSRGGGWAIHYGLTRSELFGAIGGHSAAIFRQDSAKLDDWLEEIPRDSLPKVYLDAGDKDQALSGVLSFIDLLAEMGVPHEWRLYSGLHEEAYWRAHVDEYLRWYGNVLE